MRILIVKLSSLGDVIKALPVIDDIRHALPRARIDWAVERPCDGLVALHPGIDRVVPLELRRYRKESRYLAGLRAATGDLGGLRARRYGRIVDLQGRVKSALVAALARGPVAGPEPGPSSEAGYQHLYRQVIGRAAFADLDAIAVNRMLCARALGYTMPGTLPRFGLRPPAGMRGGVIPASAFAVLVHGSSRPAKTWPESRWIETGRHLARRGLRCLLPWGDAAEAQRSHRLAAAIGDSIVPEGPLPLANWAGVLAAASVVVGVDSGLTHLAAACGAPTVAIFVATQARVFGLQADTPHRNLGDVGTAPTSEEVLGAVDEVLAESAAASASMPIEQLAAT